MASFWGVDDQAKKFRESNIFDGEMRLARPKGHSVGLVATLVNFAWFHNMVKFFWNILIEIDQNP